MWKRLGELNKEFSEIKKAQKDSIFFLIISL